MTVPRNRLCKWPVGGRWVECVSGGSRRTARNRILFYSLGIYIYVISPLGGSLSKHCKSGFILFVFSIDSHPLEWRFSELRRNERGSSRARDELKIKSFLTILQKSTFRCRFYRIWSAILLAVQFGTFSTLRYWLYVQSSRLYNNDMSTVRYSIRKFVIDRRPLPNDEITVDFNIHIIVYHRYLYL